MKFLVDENLPIEVAELLRADGHEAVTVGELRLAGTKDIELAKLLKAETRAIVTLDVDFGNTRLYPPADYFGLVVMRLERQDKLHVLAVVRQVLPALKNEVLEGKLWVVEEDRIRIR